MYCYYYRQVLVGNPLSAAYLVRWKWLNIAVIYFEVVETQTEYKFMRPFHILEKERHQFSFIINKRLGFTV